MFDIIGTMRKLDGTERFIMTTSTLCVVFALGVAIWTTIKEKNLQKQKTCECRCFDAGYESALMDIQVLSDSKPKVKRSREDY